jgi:ubiquinone/menaquinone biosynthesis C-methylase UbiE
MAADDRFATKAEAYARYRWDYRPEAIQCVLDAAAVSKHTVVADVGSGTGMLAKHFVGAAGTVYAIEPSPAMRRVAERDLAKHPSVRSIDAPSHATTLAGHSVDLIVVGQATHFFDAEPTRVEFLRILKPGGWLATLNYRNSNEKARAALKTLQTEENGCDMTDRRTPPAAFWFGHDRFDEHSFVTTRRQSLEQFLGRVSSASWAPGRDHPLYARFERAARDLFDRLATNGLRTVSTTMRVAIGQPC